MSRAPSQPGVGAPSILLIIVVLSLTTFGVLTLLSARADSTLTERTAEATAAYYAADEAAQLRLRELDEALLAGVAPDDIEGLTADTGGQGAYMFFCETGDGRAIRVRVRCDGGQRCTVLAYQLVHLTGWDKQDDLMLATPIE